MNNSSTGLWEIGKISEPMKIKNKGTSLLFKCSNQTKFFEATIKNDKIKAYLTETES